MLLNKARTHLNRCLTQDRVVSYFQEEEELQSKMDHMEVSLKSKPLVSGSNYMQL
jgi:hypothetical protein